MKQYVLVEFLAKGEDRNILIDKLEKLGSDYIPINKNNEYETSDDYFMEEWLCISGQINPEYASIIKLQDPFLAERMRISYISNDLKNKYRK